MAKIFKYRSVRKSVLQSCVRPTVEAMEERVMLSTYVVNTFVDQTNPSNSSTISLRDALARAAAHAGPDTIDVPAGDYKLTLGELLISDTTGTVTINATGGTAVIDAQNSSRALEVAAKSVVLASGISIINGSFVFGGEVDGPNGGGILNSGNLSLSNSNISASNATMDGGGIFNSGTLTLANVTVSNNVASPGSGGGIENAGTLKFTGGTISGNSAEAGGGGILNETGATATVVGVTVSTNNSDEEGGGINNFGTLALSDSTLSGNTLYSSTSGGIYSLGNATVTDTTIVGNEGGIESGAPLTLGNSLVADNSPSPTDEIPDIDGAVTSLGGNLIGQIDASTGWIASDHVGSSTSPLDPKLTALGNFGGSTQTYVPLAGSPALGGGVVAAIPTGVTTDQRGLPRVVGGKVDIGAVEVQAAPLIKITPPAMQSVHAGSVLKVNLGTISDPSGKGPFVVDVQWGDGTPNTVFSQASAGTIAAQNHDFIHGGSILANVAVTDAGGDLSNLATIPVSVIVPPAIAVVVNTTKDQTDSASSKTVSLRDAVARANHGYTATTITFDPTVFAKPQTITLTGAGLELSDTFGQVSLIAPAAGVTINGNGATDVLTIDANVAASLIGVSITNPSGGGIQNAGHLNIASSVIFNTDQGISNSGSLVVQDSTISGNSATDGSSGAGLYNTGTATVDASTFSGDTAEYGGPLPISPVGGAIANAGLLSMTNSTLSGNSANRGGGLYNSGTATVSDCTFNANYGYGGGIDNTSNRSPALLTLANSIVAGNSYPQAYGGNPDVAGSIHSLGHNLIGNIDGGNGNSTGWIASDLTGTTAHPIDPKLSPLANYGGPTQTQFPEVGSPAIGAGSVALIPGGFTTDERGFARVVGGKVDIGAVELQHASTITVTAPAKQSVTAGVLTTIQLGSFTDPGVSGPYTAVIVWGDGSAQTSFSVSAAGSLTFKHEFINTGSLTGSISVHDKAGDISNLASFSISSAVAPPITIVVNTAKDQIDATGSTTVSLRDAINRADGVFGPVAITFNSTVFATAQTISLGKNFPSLEGNIFATIALVGPTAGVTLSGGGFNVDGGVHASLLRFTISKGAGVVNAGYLSITDCTITANANLNGAGIDNTGTLTLANSTVSGNTATEQAGFFKGPYYFGGQGGGVYNSGSMTVTDSVISNNKAQYGGGIYNTGTLTLTGSTVANNHAATNPAFSLPGAGGGGIDNSGILTVNESTISGNADSTGQAGGILFNYRGPDVTSATLVDSTIANNTGGGILTSLNDGPPTILTLRDCTVSGNVGGGITISPYGNAVKTILANTIIAGNTISGSGPGADVSGKFTSLGHNLIGKKDGSTGWISSDLTGTNAKPLNANLSALGNNGGPTQTMIPLSGSPARGAGSVSLIPTGITMDQRGLARVVGGKVDIGATETPMESPFGGSPAPFGLIQAENFDLGGQGSGYYDPGNVNQGGVYRTTEGVGITPIPSADGGGYAVGYTLPGEYLNYTVNVAATGTYTLSFRVSSQPKGGTFHLNVDGNNVTGSLSIPSTGNYNTYTIVSKTGVSLTAGVHVLQLVIDSSGTGTTVAGNFDWIQAIKTS